jgi:urease accessory protein
MITAAEGTLGPTGPLRAPSPRERGGGRLQVVAARAGERTVLRRLYSEGTLKAMRVHHLDPALPSMASPGGGVLQGDRLEIDVSIQEGARLNVGTTSSTRIYAMPHGQAEMRTRFNVASGAYGEFVPDPFIPYAGSRFTGQARHVVAEGGSLLLAEVVGPGRQARGEILAYDFFTSETEVRRPDGRLLFRDMTRLWPTDGLGSPGVLAGWSALGALYAISDGLDASVFESTMVRCAEMGLSAGCSELPNGAGSWFRVMAADGPSAHEMVRSAWAAAHVHLLGVEPPASRRY